MFAVVEGGSELVSPEFDQHRLLLDHFGPGVIKGGFRGRLIGDTHLGSPLFGVRVFVAGAGKDATVAEAVVVVAPSAGA